MPGDASRQPGRVLLLRISPTAGPTGNRHPADRRIVHSVTLWEQVYTSGNRQVVPGVLRVVQVLCRLVSQPPVSFPSRIWDS